MSLNDSFNSQKIALKDLQLWDENARFPDKYFTKSDQELINYLLSKKNFKIRELAESVVADFDLPQLEKMIVYSVDEKLIVLEGNRRLTVYKLLIDPSLALDNKLQDYFTKLKIQINLSDDYLIDCLVTKDLDQGLRYIDRKHANGNNEVNWGPSERDHYDKRRGRAKKEQLFKIAIAGIIKELNLPESVKEEILGHGYVTTFYRILYSSPSMELFGLELNDDGTLQVNDSDFTEKLRVIILNVLGQQDFRGEKLNSRTLNKNEDISKYLRSIKKEDYAKVEKVIEKSKQKNVFGEETLTIPKITQKRVKPKSFSRSYLIPKTCLLNIPETKIHNIYRELRDDLLLDGSAHAVPNAVGVMFRVFLELTIDYFLDKVGQTVSPNDTISQKLPRVIKLLKDEGIATDQELSSIKKVASSSNSSTNSDLLSIENFHQYVHSYREQPTSSALILKWDNLQGFFVIIWNYINNKS